MSALTIGYALLFYAATAVLVFVLGSNGVLGRGEGVLLLALGVVYTVLLVRTGMKAKDQAPAADDPPEGPAPARNLAHLVWLALGLVLLVGGAGLLVEGSETTARALGISELVIGLTVVAAGTSLPELATSFVAAFRGQRDIAVGNVVGSNIFNSLVVLGAAGLASGTEGVLVPLSVLTFDLPVTTLVVATSDGDVTVQLPDGPYAFDLSAPDGSVDNRLDDDPAAPNTIALTTDRGSVTVYRR